jgi:hypothetical protein
MVDQLANAWTNYGKKKIIILASIMLCEWGFSKQNTLKSALQLHLQLNNLDALMCISLLESMLLIWIGQIEWWRNIQDRQILSLEWLITIVSSFLYMYFFQF